MRTHVVWGIACAVLALTMVACEEMIEGSGAATQSDRAVVQKLQRDLPLPSGVEVVRVGTSGNLVTFVVRNPGAERAQPAGQRRRAAATAPADHVASRFDTPPRAVRNDRDTLQFMETATYLEVQASLEKAQRELKLAEDFVQVFGTLLEVGGLDMDAVRAWVTRQRGVVNYMGDWLRDGWPAYFVDVELPVESVTVPYLNYTVLFEITGKVGVPLSVTLPAATGGLPPLTYWVDEYENDCGSMSGRQRFPSGLTFDPATRIVSGTPLYAGHGAFWYGVYDSHPECQDDFDTVAWKFDA